MLAELLDLQPRLGGELVDLLADVLDLCPCRWRRSPSSRGCRAWRRAGSTSGRARSPGSSSRKSSRDDAIALGEAHQPALDADQALVDVVELLDQRIDAVLVERQRLHVADDLFLELLVLALLGGRERRVLQLGLDVLVLQAAQLLVGVGDAVEGLEHLRLELGLHGREGDVVLHVVFVEVSLGDRRLLAVGAVGDARGSRDGLASSPLDLGRALAFGARIGGLEVDDVAQEDLAVVQLVAPDDDGLEGERALAEPGDHRLAAGLDALGDGDLALAGEQLDRAHLAQVHAHGVVGAVGGLGASRPRRRRRAARPPRGRRWLFLVVGGLGRRLAALARRPPRDSTTLMPISLSIARMSSIWSDVTSSEGSTSFSSS